MNQDNMQEAKRGSRKKAVAFVLILLAIAFVFGASYALFTIVLVGQREYTIEAEGLRLTLNESATAQSISLANVIPVTDEEGMENAVYRFSLENREKQDLNYTIYLREEAFENMTPTSAIRYHYTRDVDSIAVTRNLIEQQTDDGKYYLETGVIPANNTYQYEFQMWIDYRAGNEVLNTKFSVHLEIRAQQAIEFYQEEILNGCDPVISDKLVPVVIESDGTVKKASLYKEWYRYANQEWANAVVLNTSKTYQIGDIIPESSIESYFVWIPRYRYKIFNLGSYTNVGTLSTTAVQTIEVEFENKNTEPSVGAAKDAWLSHPAFQAFDSNGFWVGKFETGYRGALDKTEAEVNSTESMKVIIKPDVYSWRNITIGNAFETSYNYLRKLDSHMMKNTEWGAVAYLQHSIYGSQKSVRVNNSSDYKTGYAVIMEPTCGPTTGNVGSECNVIGSDADSTLLYNTPTGYAASTTGNITGIYDMSGGVWEYVMGYNTNATKAGDASAITNIYGDFFTNSKWNKYYDKYSNNGTTEVTFNKRILGDATGELGPFATVKDPDGSSRNRGSWYGDYARFPSNANPWFRRGGHFNIGSLAGVFGFGNTTGVADSGMSFRIVLTPNS